MCKPRHPPLGKRVQLQIAKLMQMHKETHPAEVGAYFGVSRQWARRLWNRFTPEELRGVSEEEALGVLALIRHGQAHSIQTQRVAVESLCAAGAAISNRGCEPCAERAVPRVTTRNTGRKV